MFLSFSSIDFITNILMGNSNLTPFKGKDFILKFIYKHIKKIETFEDYISRRNIIDETIGLSEYLKENIKNIRGCSLLTNFVEAIFNNYNLFIDDTVLPYFKYSIEEALVSFNNHMATLDEENHARDCYFIKLINKRYVVIGLEDALVDFRTIQENDDIDNYHLINQNVEKCLKRLQKDDYLGTITVARTVLEQLVREIIIKKSEHFNNDDKLPKLVNKCVCVLGLSVSGLPEEVKQVYGQITTGLSSISIGLGTMRNCMSDAHSISCLPTKKDAILAINSSRTLSVFLLERYCELKAIEVA